MPKFYKWDGGSLSSQWSLGWQTGEDNDLIAIRRRVKTKNEGDLFLSPVCDNRFLALYAFVLKYLLSGVDHNMNV
ncbi:MAG: hypothetical protein MUO97_12455 [Dehalococcoidia bacterium]|nr:hypothetical protein [Dehalococcoidia bacterium]